MPIHFEDLDIINDIAGLRSALIVPCYVCPAVTVSVREKKPYMQLSRSFLRSAPFEKYLEELRSRFEAQGVHTKIFKSRFYLHWFMCMWPAARQRKLKEQAAKYDAVIVLGCESATSTVLDSVNSLNCKVIPGMQVTGIMNATLRISLLGKLSFSNHKIVSISGENDRDGRFSTFMEKKACSRDSCKAAVKCLNR